MEENSKIALIVTNKIRKAPSRFLELTLNPLKERGFRVVWAGNFSFYSGDIKLFPCETLNVPIQTNPFNPKNLKAMIALLRFIRKNQVAFLQCSTPIGGLLGRVCGHIKKIPVIYYEAHGFLFFKHGPKLGWFFYLIEKRLANWTNYITTINQQDYSNALSFHLRKNGKVFFMHGAGEDLSLASLPTARNIRNDFSIGKNSFVFLSVGELNSNKNVKATIKAFYFFHKKRPDSFLLVCGDGNKKRNLQKLIKRKKLDGSVFLAGFQKNIFDYFLSSDAYITTSKREGISRTILEAMFFGLPCIVSNRRGMNDLISEPDGGFLVEPTKAKQIAQKMYLISQLSSEQKKTISDFNKKIYPKYSFDVVITEKILIYQTMLGDGANS